MFAKQYSKQYRTSDEAYDKTSSNTLIGAFIEQTTNYPVMKRHSIPDRSKASNFALISDTHF